MSGKSRVIIENIQPVVDGGLYPAKRTVGERVAITADIFCDGHDHIRAEVLYRHESIQNWISIELMSSGNDTGRTSFPVTEKGTYYFRVRAWIDHFETWHDGFKKKASAGVDVTLELLEGADFLLAMSAEYPELKSHEERLRDIKQKEENIKWITGGEFEEIVQYHPYRQNMTEVDQEFAVLVETEKALYSTWYEIFPRSASLKEGVHGTLKDVIRLLPRISAMNFDVLYMPPVHPIGKINRKGKNNRVKSADGEPGSPWAIGSDAGGHKAIHPDLGTLDDYKLLIREAKKQGIEVAMDLAFQCAPDHPYVTEHPEWFKQRPDGSIQYAENPPKKYQDIYPFNFECDDWKALWEELKSVVDFWVGHGVTIFRVDNPHTKPIPFWHWIISETHKTHPDIIFLSEAFTRPKIMASLAKIGFTQSYTYFTWRNTKQEIIEYMNELVNGPSRNYFRPNFWPNTPDILPWHLQYQGENIYMIRLALASTLSSSYGIYGPAFEFMENEPIPGKEEYFDSEKFEIRHYDWRKTNRITDVITLLNKARKEHKALQSTWNLTFCSLDLENSNMIAYIKATHNLESIVLVVVSLDPHQKQSGYVQLPLSLRQKKVNVKLNDLVTGEYFTWTQEWNYIELDPHRMPFHIFKLELHESQM